ncbi:MAG: D-alanyl-D-alanine carboxypeptidase, partial [Thiobacillaceae bacterium]|nr:D-alanyl-D-alanine carboxypeptidase [Thiobacillaceae bacterium]
RGLGFAELVIDNGSGLSRSERISADSLNRLLLDAWKNPVMPEFISSMPIVGIDGTMKKRLKESGATGRAHIKTGTLDGVKTAAGYALDAQGRRVAVTFLINDPRAAAGGPAIDALINWVAQRRAGEKAPALENE